MSRDICQGKKTSSVDISWEKLIRDSEQEIELAKEKIKQLSSSIRFFKKKQAVGEKFPLAATHN